MSNFNSYERNVIWAAYCTHVRNLPNVGYGGTTDRGIRGQVRKRGEIGWKQLLIYTYPFPLPLPQFFYLPLFNSVVQKKKVVCRKHIWGGFALPLLPPLVAPMLIHKESDFKGHHLFYNSILGYRVIHMSLRKFRTRLRNNQERHGRKEHINR